MKKPARHSSSFAPMAYLPGLLFCMLLAAPGLQAQQLPQATSTEPNRKKDTTNTDVWDEVQGKIYYTRLNDIKKYYIDSSIHTFHRKPFTRPWNINTGNLGSPARSLFFDTDNNVFLRLGYRAFDVYRFNVDSLNFYNTTKPYSDFTFQMGAKLEQLAQIFHTQNISPNWNFSFKYRKITSTGFYKIQRTNHDNFAVSSNYQSKNQRYQLYAGITYNKEQNDENGGILYDSLLTNPAYSDRQTIAVAFDNDSYSSRRSSVSNTLRDINALLFHSYTWGKRDTLYNEDSSKYWTRITPRFRIDHKLNISSEKLRFKDYRPDSTRYVDLFNTGFELNDSLYFTQNHNYIDNRFLLNGILGKRDNPVSFNAGIGNRTEQFITYFVSDKNTLSNSGNYLVGQIKKEGSNAKAWNIQANALFIFTGKAIGSFNVDGFINKALADDWADITLGAQQQLRDPAYNTELYQHKYALISNSFSKESNTHIYGNIVSKRLHLNIGVRNMLLANYIYLNSALQQEQYAPAFNMLQAWLQKTFYFGSWVLDNEIAFQQVSASAPVNVPTLAGRHQLSIETAIFRKRLQVASGLEVRYYTNYNPDGYAPLLNRYFYQTAYKTDNTPEASVFFNFKVKRLRAYIMVDQLQQLLWRNTIHVPGYPSPNFNLRFGFNWVMLN